MYMCVYKSIQFRIVQWVQHDAQEAATSVATPVLQPPVEGKCLRTARLIHSHGNSPGNTSWHGTATESLEPVNVRMSGRFDELGAYT